MTLSNNLLFSFVEQSQSQKEVTVNEALAKIDATINRGAISIGSITPPISPNEGDLYILGDSTTDDWLDHDKEIAYYFNGAWKFLAPNEGLTIWVNDEDTLYSYDGVDWVASISAIGVNDLTDITINSALSNEVLQYDGTNFVNTSNLDNISRVGVNTTADATNKLSVKSDAVLFNTNTGNSQVKINKTSSSDNASFLLQDGFSGRAEFGLIGDDDFQLKVSADGSSFYQSFVVDRTSGKLNIKQDVDFADKAVTRAELKDYSETVSTNAASGAAATINIESGNVHQVTLTDDCTFTFSNPPSSGKAGSFTLILKQDATGGRSITWPSSVKWSGSSAPTLTTSSNSVDILTFMTTDAGTIWYGFLGGSAMG